MYRRTCFSPVQIYRRITRPDFSRSCTEELCRSFQSLTSLPETNVYNPFVGGAIRRARLQTYGRIFSLARTAPFQVSSFTSLSKTNRILGSEFRPLGLVSSNIIAPYSPLVGIRFYRTNSIVDSADRFYQARHLKPPGFKIVLTVVLVAFGGLVTFYFGKIDTVPYTGRTRIIILSIPMEKLIGETYFKYIKTIYKEKILSEIHPERIELL